METFAELKPIITEAVETALRAYFMGVGVRPQQLVPDKNLEKTWRQKNLLRYPKRGWNYSLIQLLPFRSFRPFEIFAEHAATLGEKHPNHHNLRSAIANVLAVLLKDGVLAKVSMGVYVPAVDGVPLILAAAPAEL